MGPHPSCLRLQEYSLRRLPLAPPCRAAVENQSVLSARW